MANEVTKQEKNYSVGNYLANLNTKKRFEDILGKKAAGFIASITNISKLPGLKDVEPSSIISSALVAATLDLPIEPNLGFAYIVPYTCKENGAFIKKGQFQMGYKGFVQLAMRTGQYKTINAIKVFEGDIKRIDRLTGDIEFNEESNSEKIVGYIAYFKLLNGFEKTLYMTVVQMEKHAKKYSQTYKSENEYVRKNSKWTTDFDSMAIKTVIKLLLSKYGVLSIEMNKAMQTDQAVIKNEVADGAEINIDTITYPDAENIQEADFTDVKTEHPTKLDSKFKKDEKPIEKVNEEDLQKLPWENGGESNV